MLDQEQMEDQMTTPAPHCDDGCGGEVFVLAASLELDIDLSLDLNVNYNLDYVDVTHDIDDDICITDNSAYLDGSALAIGSDDDDGTLVSVEYDVLVTDCSSSVSVNVVAAVD
jgi:hypothetical protein